MKKITKLLGMLVLIISLTGCMKIDADILVIDEDTLQLKMVFLVEESYLTMSGNDISDLKDELQNGDTSAYEDATYKEISQTINGDNYVGYEIITGDLDAKEQGYTISMDGSTCTLEVGSNDLSSDLMGESLDEYEYYFDQMEKLGFEMNISFTMPGKITNASYGTIDGNKLTITFNELAESTSNKLKIVSEESTGIMAIFSNNAMLFGIIAAIIVVAGIAILLILKKNKANQVLDVPVNEGYTPDVASMDTPSAASVEEVSTSQVNDVVEEKTEELDVPTKEDLEAESSTKEVIETPSTNEDENID